MNKFIPFLLLGLSSPVMAHDYHQPHTHVYSHNTRVEKIKCFKRIYREEYVPGTRRNPGYVRTYVERKRVPCRKINKNPKFIQPHYHPRHNHSKVDDNSCIEGAVIGGVLGGGAGGALSTKENWIWSIPTGVVSGALIGCQIDGG